MKKWKNRCTAWIACLAILAAAFVPSISTAMALAHEAAAFEAPICSPEHAAHTTSDPATAPTKHNGHADHCPLCVKHASSYDLLQRTAEFSFPEIVVASRVTAARQDRSYSAVAWIHLPPRAPPVIS